MEAGGRRRMRSALLCLGFYLLQAVLGTTVIPLCEPNEMENCTTALVQTENNPRVAQVRTTRCKAEMQDYCFHGQCMYLVDLDEHYFQTENNPRVAQVRTTRCKAEMQDYCFHGQCMYLVDLDEHYCRCDLGFSGVRCVHSELVTQHLSKEYLALTIILSLFFLIAVLVVTYYVYEWYQHKKARQANNQEYKEVDVHEKNPVLLP